ncbi:zf-HC2 domain-containing protein [Nocardia sp. NPDC003693]
MTAEHELCEGFTTWDGAYVLGALARAERRAYEEHLAGCAPCRAAVAELTGLPGLLTLVDPETAISLAARPDPPDTVPPPPERLLPGLAARAARARVRRRRWAAGGAIAAAAAAACVAVPVTAAVVEHQRPAVEVVAQGPLLARVETPITATFEVRVVDGQTRVDMRCDYPPSEDVYSWQLSLWVVRDDGTQSKLAEWTAVPGRVFTPDGTTSVAPDRLRAVEVRNGYGKVLLAADI